MVFRKLSTHATIRPWGLGPALATLFVLAALQPAFSQEGRGGFVLATRTTLGLIYGGAEELVYNQAVSPNYRNSLLAWPVSPQYLAGAALTLETRSGYFAELELRQGFPGKAGTMSDSDYLRGDGIKTHYSESDCYAERATLLDLSLGYRLALSSSLELRAMCGLSYMDFKWSGRDGFYQYPTSGYGYSMDSTTGSLVPGTYPPWSAGETKTPIYGTGIIYEQSCVAVLFGLAANWSFLGQFKLGLSASVSPLVYCYAVDNHEDRGLNFYSFLSGGLMLEPRVSLGISLSSRASLELSLAYRSVAGLVGDISQVNQGVTQVSSQDSFYAGPDSATSSSGGSGATLSMLEASLGLRLVL